MDFTVGTMVGCVVQGSPICWARAEHANRTATPKRAAVFRSISMENLLWKPCGQTEPPECGRGITSHDRCAGANGAPVSGDDRFQCRVFVRKVLKPKKASMNGTPFSGIFLVSYTYRYGTPKIPHSHGYVKQIFHETKHHEISDFYPIGQRSINLAKAR